MADATVDGANAGAVSNDELTRLRAENQKLARDVSSLTDELKETRHEARDRRHENKTLTEQLAGLTKERDSFKTQAEADPDGLRAELDRRSALIRELRHGAAFADVARKLKVNDPVKQQDLIRIANYQPEGDEPDESKITAAYAEALKGRAWLVDAPLPPAAAPIAPGGATVTAQAQSGAKPGPGADRGESVSATSSSAATRVVGRL
jgi:hypothetical protein